MGGRCSPPPSTGRSSRNPSTARVNEPSIGLAFLTCRFSNSLARKAARISRKRKPGNDPTPQRHFSGVPLRAQIRGQLYRTICMAPSLNRHQRPFLDAKEEHCRKK